MFRISTQSTIACILLFVGCIQASELGKTTRVQLCISADSNKKATTSISIPRPWFLPSWIPWSETWCPRGTMKRSAIIYTPNGLEGDDVPLVMNIHALGANAQEGFSKAKLGTPFPAPPGVPSYSFNAGGCCSDKPVDDINFLRKLIGFMESESDYAIDSERIYVTGMSNGGFMTNRVACEMSDLVAAAAPVAGVLFESYNLTTRHPLGWDKAPDFVCGP